MNVNLIIHRQLSAREILVVGDKWKELYDFFQEGAKKYGIYFYTYKNNNVPFFIGKCTAKSFNILGRVWDELDDCDRGSSWLGKDISLLEEFEQFNEGDPNGGSFNPWKKITGKNLKNKIKRFLDNLIVTFSYIDTNEDTRIIDKILSDIEIILQEKLIERHILSKNWIDSSSLNGHDHTKNYTIDPVYKMEGSFFKIDPSIFV